jgi:uncharacterized membrane protein
MANEQWDSYETRALRVGRRISFSLALLGSIGTGFTHSMLYYRYENGQDVFENIPLDVAALALPALAIAFQLLSNNLYRREKAIHSNIHLHHL